MPKAKTIAALKPPPSLLCKLASIAAHAGEAIGPKGHQFDMVALQQLLKDQEVTDWLNEMLKHGMAVVVR